MPRIRARFTLLLSAMATFRPPERVPMLLLTDRDSAFALLEFFSSPAVTLTLPAVTFTPAASSSALFFAPRCA